MIFLHLAKVSTAQDVDPDDHTFQWKHEYNNLHLVIDSFQQGGSGLQVMKVTQGTEVLQLIQLEELIRKAQSIIEKMKGLRIELKGDQLPISAIVRCPLLAIRWQLPNDKIRRLQIRFRSKEDYDVIYQRLHQLGLYMIPHQTKERGSTARSEQLRTGLQPSVSPARSEHERTGPPCPPSRLSEISSRPYTAVSAPTIIESQIQEAAHPRPNSAFAGSASTFPNPLTPPVHFPRPDSASVVSPDRTVGVSPCEPQVTTVERHEVHVARPETALLFDLPDTAELPPRRELPFRRDSLPTSAGSDNTRPHSRPSTGVMGPPPLPGRVSDLRPSSAHSIGMDSELPPLRQPTIVADTAKKTPVQQRPHTPRPHLRGCSKPGQGLTIFEDQLSFTPVSSSPQTYPSPAATSPLGKRPLSAVSNDHHDRPGSSSPGIFACRPASGSRDGSDRAIAANLSHDAENTLKAYALQNVDRRRAALNSFIFRSLDDKHFLTLVEDVETNWVRFGLGPW